MGFMLTARAVRDRSELFDDLSLTTFAVYLHLLDAVMEYTAPTEEWDGTRTQALAQSLEEIHPSRWKTWKSQPTLASELGLSGKGAIKPHLDKLRVAGLIRTVWEEGKTAPTHVLVNRWQGRAELQAASAEAVVALVTHHGQTADEARERVDGLGRVSQDERDVAVMLGG